MTDKLAVMHFAQPGQHVSYLGASELSAADMSCVAEQNRPLPVLQAKETGTSVNTIAVGLNTQVAFDAQLAAATNAYGLTPYNLQQAQGEVHAKAHNACITCECS